MWLSSSKLSKQEKKDEDLPSYSGYKFNSIKMKFKQNTNQNIIFYNTSIGT